MSITRDIVENRHHGTISFDSTEGEGTTFVLCIPIKK
jgi:signal transduction histidine kinase